VTLDLDTVTWERAALLLVVCALSSSAATEVVRQTLGAYLLFRGLDKKAWWRRGLLRGLAVLAGALSGYYLGANEVGAVLGAAGGGLSTAIVAATKGVIKRKAAEQ
jgi:hypothetical protein|tara:strand:- start:580 stop:897 length:318 start_codon:yes stop_codon:yes gene_type:complete